MPSIDRIVRNQRKGVSNGQPTMSQEAADPISIKHPFFKLAEDGSVPPKYRNCNATEGNHSNKATLHLYVILSFRAKRRFVRCWLCYLEFFEMVTEQRTAEQAGAVRCKVSSP